VVEAIIQQRDVLCVHHWTITFIVELARGQSGAVYISIITCLLPVEVLAYLLSAGIA